MPRGDGQGGNNGQGEERGPRSLDEILAAKLKLHEQAAAGEIDSKESREFHAFAAEKVRAELAELVERGAGMLEAIEGRSRLAEVLAIDGERIEPRQIAVAQLGLSQRTLNGLEEYGILWAGELSEWTEAMVRCGKNFGTKAVEEIRAALAGVGLRLREPREGEEAALPSRHSADRTASRASPQLIAARQNEPVKRKRLLATLAGGASQGEAVAAIGLNKSQFGVATRLKRAIRDRLQAGDEAAQIAADEGFPPGSALGEEIAAYIETLRTVRLHNRRPA
jgi:hypothetical protein